MQLIWIVCDSKHMRYGAHCATLPSAAEIFEMGETLKSIDLFGSARAAAVHTVITDIDDTITTDGLLTAAAYSALEQLRLNGLRVVVTTGRPAGWCDHIARMWPVDAVVGENGGCCYWYDRQARKLGVRHSLGPEALHTNRERLNAVAKQVLLEVPGTALASDQFCRLYDVAIDFCEDVPRVSDDGAHIPFFNITAFRTV
jgi:hypothetical protein